MKDHSIAANKDVVYLTLIERLYEILKIPIEDISH